MGLKQEIRKLYADLDDWIYIGIGDDIVNCRDQRPEYKSLVIIAENRGIDKSKIPRAVKYLLRQQLNKSMLTLYAQRIVSRIKKKLCIINTKIMR